MLESSTVAPISRAITTPPIVNQPEAPDALTIYDPSPATLARLAGLERAQVVVQSRSRPILQEFLKAWNNRMHEQSSRVRWHFDVDPLEF